MAVIIPIRDLKNTNEISSKCRNTDEPIFITKNGYGDMVIMSMKVYERLFENSSFKGIEAAEIKHEYCTNEIPNKITKAAMIDAQNIECMHGPFNNIDELKKDLYATSDLTGC